MRESTPGAQEELFQLVYHDLKRLARARMSSQKRQVTLQPTALVHEAYLRLVGPAAPEWENRKHFFHSAARAMRSVLVDLARRRVADKRGGVATLMSLQEGDADARDEVHDVLAVHEALERLEAVDPVGSQVVELRFFGGLTIAETAGALGLTERSVYRNWSAARVWLFRELSR